MNKRSAGVWIISGYFVVTGVLTLHAYGLAAAGYSKLPKDTLLFDGENLLPSLVTVGVSLCGLIGGVMLFLIKKLSWLPFVAGAIIAAVGITLRFVGLAPNSTTYSHAFAGIVIFVIVAAYAKWISKLSTTETRGRRKPCCLAQENESYRG